MTFRIDKVEAREARKGSINMMLLFLLEGVHFVSNRSKASDMPQQSCPMPCLKSQRDRLNLMMTSTIKRASNWTEG